jgi:hypothetical protein
VADDLANESFHKVVSERKFLRKHLSSKQEEAVARQVGKHAGRMAEIFRDETKAGAKMNGEVWNRKNSSKLARNNQELASVKANTVKASPAADMYLYMKNDPDYQKFSKRLSETAQAKIKKVGANVRGFCAKSGKITVVGSLSKSV